MAVITSVIPKDNFAGRSAVRFGVGEFIELGADAVPPIGVLRWFIAKDESGGVLINDTRANDGTALYTAGPTAGTATLVLKVLSGPTAGTIVARETLTVVTPTDAAMVQEPGTHIEHQQGTWSVGFLGNIYLRPTDVSFNNASWQEGTCTAKRTGYLSDLPPKEHPLGTVMTVGKGNAKTGCKVNCEDFVYSGAKGQPYADGDFLWPIPWRFGVRVPSPGKPPSDSTVFTTANHHATADATGRATIQKKGFPQKPFSRVPADPTSGLH